MARVSQDSAEVPDRHRVFLAMGAISKLHDMSPH